MQVRDSFACALQPPLANVRARNQRPLSHSLTQPSQIAMPVCLLFYYAEPQSSQPEPRPVPLLHTVTDRVGPTVHREPEIASRGPIFDLSSQYRCHPYHERPPFPQSPPTHTSFAPSAASPPSASRAARSIVGSPSRWPSEVTTIRISAIPFRPTSQTDAEYRRRRAIES